MDDPKLAKFNRSSRSDCFECSIGFNDEKTGKMAFVFDFSLSQPISRSENGAQTMLYLMAIVLATLGNFQDWVSLWSPRAVTARYTYTMGKPLT